MQLTIRHKTARWSHVSLQLVKKQQGNDNRSATCIPQARIVDYSLNYYTSAQTTLQRKKILTNN